MNLRILSRILRPQRVALKTELKLSSKKIIDEASLAISHPLPIQNPTSAFLRAVTSLRPSPVTATYFPMLYKATMKESLCSGVQRARTLIFW